LNDRPDLSIELMTLSDLAGNRRRPSEYEIVSTDPLWSTDDWDACRASLGLAARGARTRPALSEG